MRLSTLLVAAALLSVALPVHAQEGAAPRDSGIVESTGVDLVLIDVDASDSDGNPRKGLTRDDFQVFLNGREIEVETVDDLSNCGFPVRLKTSRFVDPFRARHYVLYFDYSQLDSLGREHAHREARRWLRNLAPQSSLVMVAAFSTDTGVERLSGFVSPDKAQVALADLKKAKRFRDVWPQERMSALADCFEDGTMCREEARDDYDHTRRSLRAMLFFLNTIESTVSSKTMLLFHQNLTAEPARLFGPGRLAELLAKPTPLPGGDEHEIVKDNNFQVGDHWDLIRELSGTAFIARTTIYPIYAGAARATWSVNFGANLAQQTGGEYNYGPGDLRDTLRHAEERCPGTYRLGIRPTRLGVHLRSRLKVHVQGSPVLTMHDIRLPDSVDRWHRRAEAVLTNPEASRELPIEASLVPALNSEGKWAMKAIVSFDARALEMLPEGERVKGEWEVGALVVNRRSGKVWEMLGVSEVTAKAKPGDESYIVHEYPFDEARPGDYEIRAFIRDKWTNVFGGGRGELTLPKLARGSILGPLPMLDGTEQVRTTLPLRKKKIQAKHRDTARSTTGPVPVGDAPLTPGSRLQISSWACGARDTPPSVFDASLVGESGRRRLDAPEVTRVGHCAEAISTVDTGGLNSGDYEYVIRWNLGGDGPTNGSTLFRLAAAGSSEAADDGVSAASAIRP